MRSLNSQMPTSLASTLEDLPRRVSDIAALRGLGYTYNEIGAHFGVTAQAISVALVRYRRRLKSARASKHMMALSPRAINVLSKHRIADPEDIRLPVILENLHGERNCGAKTIMEIRRWAGLAQPLDVVPRPQIPFAAAAPA